MPLKTAHAPTTRDAERGVRGRGWGGGAGVTVLNSRIIPGTRRRPASPLVATALEHTPRLDHLLRRISTTEHVLCPEMSLHCALVQGHGRRIQLSEDAVGAALAPKWRHKGRVRPTQISLREKQPQPERCPGKGGPGSLCCRNTCHRLGGSVSSLFTMEFERAGGHGSGVTGGHHHAMQLPSLCRFQEGQASRI